MSRAPENTGSTGNEACIHGDPPQLTAKLPSTEDVTTETRKRDDAPLPVDVVLLTVKRCEFLACYSQLVRPFRCWFDNVGFVYFEDVDEGKVKVALVTCYEGSCVPGGSLMTVKNAAAELRPKAVIAVGACSSLNPQKAKLGDVVVSSKLTTYASKVVTANNEQSAGVRSYVSRRFLNIIKHSAYGYKAPLQDPQAHKFQVHCDGEFLSGPELVCAEWKRRELAERHTQAIAIEMEGEGIFTAAFDDQIEWLIVKGIADYADDDGLTTESWSPFASLMAVSVVQHLLSNPDVFHTWPNYHCEESCYDGQGSTQARTKRAQKRKWTEQHADADDSSSHHGTNPKREKVMISTERLTVGASHPTHIIQRIRQIYEKREGQVLPVPWCEEFSFHLKNIFTTLRIVGKEKTRGQLTDEITNMTSIFRAHNDCQNPQIVLIEAEPGMGKTTYCQKLAYDWATKQDHQWDESFPKIEVCLLLRCRDIKSNIWEAIEEQILPKEVDEEAKETFFQFIREQPSKVLLVLDGLDEVEPNKLAMYVNLIERRLLPGCRIVLTSRHEAGKKVRRYCDTLWEIVGFTKEHAKRFIRKHFQNKEHLGKDLIKKLWPWERKYDDDDDDDDDYDDLLCDLRNLTQNPLHLALLCILFEDFSGILPNSRTQLFIEIVNCILRRYEKKNGLSSNSENLVAVYKKELTQLGCLALKSLRKGEFQFEEKVGVLSGCALIKFGFLSIEPGGTKRAPCTRYGFPHKTFQEFFSGLYLAFEVLDGKIDFDTVVTDERYLTELNQVFVFLSGIIGSQCKEKALCLVSSIVAHANSTGLKSDDYLGLVFHCISECAKCKEEIYTQLAYNLGKALSRTENLNLVENHIGAEGANYLSQALMVNTTLTNLDLSVNRIGAEGANSLSKALTVNTTLTNLYLIWNRIGAEGANSLSQAIKVNTTLTNLNLSENSIGAEGVNSLSQAIKVNTTLTNLNLDWNSIGAEGTNSLSQALAVNTTLTNLNLAANGIGAEDANSLFQVLAVNSTLTNLDLAANSIGAEGANSLSQVLTVNSTLTNLNLFVNSIGAEGANSLSQALAVNTTLTNLNLCGNIIGAEGANSLSQVLGVNTTLTNLNLGWNSIGDEGAISLSKALTVNTTLTNLDLNSNRIGAEGANSLSKALTVNTTLTNLNLTGNSIGVEGANSLSHALTVNTTLTNLNLYENSIGAEGANSLSKALTVNTTLTNLNLNSNRIGTEGAISLSKALTVNTTLTNLNLNSNRIGTKGANSLSKALTVNTTLTNLDLRGNSIGAEGANSLSQTLTVNTTLTNVNLRGNSIGAEGANSLSQASKATL